MRAFELSNARLHMASVFEYPHEAETVHRDEKVDRHKSGQPETRSAQ
jgi:hypothetical protein